MILRIDVGSPVPPYEQIRAQVSTMVANGVLPAGARLPPIRQLAKDLGVASGTVARAYRELEAEAVIVTRGHRGSYVTGTGSRTPARRDEALASAARTFALQARQLGADAGRALNSAKQALDALEH